jgi:hypothetical protein
VPAPNKGIDQSGIRVLEVSMLPVSTIVIFDCRFVPSVRIFFIQNNVRKICLNYFSGHNKVRKICLNYLPCRNNRLVE